MTDATDAGVGRLQTFLDWLAVDYSSGGVVAGADLVPAWVGPGSSRWLCRRSPPRRSSDADDTQLFRTRRAYKLSVAVARMYASSDGNESLISDDLDEFESARGGSTRSSADRAV